MTFGLGAMEEEFGEMKVLLDSQRFPSLKKWTMNSIKDHPHIQEQQPPNNVVC